MSVQNENAVSGGETLVRERSMDNGVYASLFEKINLTPATGLSDLSIWQDTYGHIDRDGRYRVNMLFDRDNWETGFESLWVRQSRPYAGDTYGLHLPLLAGTEVAIGFEDGNPISQQQSHHRHNARGNRFSAEPCRC